jgi:RNA polymerase sigma factor (sigma-70 family)
MNETGFESSYSITSRIAAVRAMSIVTTFRLPKDTFHDLQQEALLELWQKRDKYDPGRAGWRTFAEHIIANRLISLMRRHQAQRRLHGDEQALDEVARRLLAPNDRIELQLDIGRVLGQVSKFERAVALSLIDSSVVQTSRHLGVSRSKVYRARRRLRTVLSIAGYG